MNKTLIKTLLSMLFWSMALTTFAQSSYAEKLRKEYDGKQAKYVFFFIGDGMGLAHINATEAYLGSQKNNNQLKWLNMSDMETQSFSTTYAENRFITGSAAAGTALATGKKTSIGTISMAKDHKTKYTTIAEKAKKKGFKIGILTTVPINHATPAVFYAHEPVRHSYYNIGKQLADSDFDFFAGGGFKNPIGRKKDQKDLVKMSEENGFTYLDTKKEFKNLTAEDLPAIAVNPRTSSGAMPYVIDMNNKDLTLAQFTQKAIDVLDNDNGFFMMIEGGKIDWAAHGNDAGTIIHDVIDFDNAVGKALDFYKKHPDETLIIVTADHETGGMSLGARSTKYLSYFSRLKNQKMSMEAFATALDKLAKHTSGFNFEVAMTYTKEKMGLGKKSEGLILTRADMIVLERAFAMMYGDEEYKSQMDAMAASYTGDNPFASAVIAMLNEKSGISFTTNAHTGIAVPVKVTGVGAEIFRTYMDNTDIPKNIEVIMGIK